MGVDGLRNYLKISIIYGIIELILKWSILNEFET